MTGLLKSMNFTMCRTDPLIIYNYVERETKTLENLCNLIAEVYNCKPPTISMPTQALIILAHIFQKISRGRSAFHPVRVKKASMQTHIVPQWLINNGFQFDFDIKKALK